MNAHTPGPQCSATVFGQRMTSWRCFRKGKVKRAGKWYCAQHDPEAKAQRQAASEKRWAEEARVRRTERWAAHDERMRRADCYPDLLAACEHVRDFCDRQVCQSVKEAALWAQVSSFVRAAIAKAEG